MKLLQFAPNLLEFTQMIAVYWNVKETVLIYSNNHRFSSFGDATASPCRTLINVVNGLSGEKGVGTAAQYPPSKCFEKPWFQE